MTHTVLIVEDEPVLRRNLAGCLRRAGMQVVDVPGIAAARDALAQQTFALACMDISLGDGDGIELIASIRSAHPDLPVIVMTGEDCVRNRVRAEHIDASAFLAKPFALARFREIVLTLLLDREGPTGESDRPRGPSVMMYSHDTIGLGHMRRNSTIAAQVVGTMPDASVLMVVGSPTGMIFDMPSGVDFIKLPSLSKVSRNQWRPGKLRISSVDTRNIRTGLIERAVEELRPDIFLVDHEPLGVWDELVPALDALRARPDRPHVVLGLRDILDDPHRTRADWERRGLGQSIARYYDEVFVYGERDVFPSDTAYGLTDLTKGGVRFCGYVTNARQGRTAPSRGDLSSPRIIVSGGGGRDAYPMMRMVMDALPRLPSALRRRTLFIAGPLMDEELRDDLAASAARHGAQFARSHPDLPSLLAAADLFVTMGGYNALTEALVTGCRTVVMPRVGPSAEQRLRAGLFAERGLVETISREEATPQRIGQILARAGRPAATAAARSLDMNGARNAARRIVEVLRERHGTGKSTAAEVAYNG